MKIFMLTILFLGLLHSKECSPYYNPDKFYEAPEYLVNLIEEHLKNKPLFGNKKEYQDFKLKEVKNNTFLNEHIKNGEYIYPKKSGLFSYKIKDQNIDEISISIVNIYRYTDISIAEEINNDFEGFWNDWIENAYEMQLTPEQILFKYKDKYFTFSVFIYGIKKDATNLKGTSIVYWLKDYTKQVKKYIQCEKNNQ
ncbi:hypothetical protein ACOJTA_01390 [Malaciobacter sp. WC5094]|uniref:hypothetical protein n=1 Tax=Arcobacter sp. YIC-80 TaxID=3376683 RepID=UPI003850CCA4